LVLLYISFLLLVLNPLIICLKNRTFIKANLLPERNLEAKRTLERGQYGEHKK